MPGAAPMDPMTGMPMAPMAPVEPAPPAPPPGPPVLKQFGDGLPEAELEMPILWRGPIRSLTALLIDGARLRLMTVARAGQALRTTEHITLRRERLTGWRRRDLMWIPRVWWLWLVLFLLGSGWSTIPGLNAAWAFILPMQLIGTLGLLLSLARPIRFTWWTSEGAHTVLIWQIEWADVGPPASLERLDRFMAQLIDDPNAPPEEPPEPVAAAPAIVPVAAAPAIVPVAAGEVGPMPIAAGGEIPAAPPAPGIPPAPAAGVSPPLAPPATAGVVPPPSAPAASTAEANAAFEASVDEAFSGWPE